MAALGKLTVELEANMAKFQAEMTKSAYVTEQAMTKMSASADMAKTAMTNLAAGAVGAIASFVGASQAIGVMMAAVDRMDKFDEMAERLAVSTQTLQEFAYAGKMTGVDLDTMGGALKKLQVSLFDANTGGKESAAVYKALGIAITDANGNLRAVPAVMGDLADVFANLQDGSTKTALAVKLFGKSGADLVPLLSAGRGGIKDMTDEANRLGGVMGGEALKAAAEFNDNLDRLSTTTQAAANSLTSKMIPAINDVINRFIEGRKAGMGFFEAIGSTTGMTIDRAYGKSYGAMLKEVNAEIEVMQNLVEKNKRNPSIIQSFGYGDKDLAPLLAKKAALQAMQRNVALADSGDGSNEDQNDRRARSGSGSMDAAVARALRESNAPKTRAVKSDAEKLAEDATKFIAKLKEEAETYGMTGAALVDYQAKQKGYSEAVQTQASVLVKRIDLLKLEDEVRKDKLKAEQEAIANTQKFIATQFESIAALQREAETYDMLPAAITRAEIAKLELHKTTLEANQGTAEEIRVTEALIAAKQRLAGAQDIRAAIDEQKKLAEDAKKIQDNFIENIQRNLGSGLFDMLDGNFRSIGDSFKRLILQMVADAAAANITAALFGSSKNGGSDGLLSGAMGAAMGYFGLSGARANGGPVMAGSSYLVGERGPEIFTPGGSGAVIPNSAMGRGGLNVNITNNAQAQVEARPSADGGLDIFINAIKNSIGEDIAYGTGPVNAAFQGRYGLRAAV